MLDTPHTRVKLSTGLTRVVRFIVQRWAVCVARALAMMLMGVLCIVLISPIAYAESTNNKPLIITYAGSILTPLELSAAIVLWTHESNIRLEARNGSHYGICQGRTTYMKRANYKQQVRWCIAYALNRYGSMVNTLKAFQLKGWH